MFLLRRQPQDAADVYKTALTADPAWVRAQVGLARAFGDDDPAGVEGGVRGREEARARESGRVAARRRARDRGRRLRGGRRGARPRRPRPREFHGRSRDARARWRTAEGRRRGCRRGHRARPRDRSEVRRRATAPRPKQAAQKYRFDDAEAFASEGRAARPGRRRRAWRISGMYLLRTGDEKDARDRARARLGARQEQSPDQEPARPARQARQVRGRAGRRPSSTSSTRRKRARCRPYALPLGREAYDDVPEALRLHAAGPDPRRDLPAPRRLCRAHAGAARASTARSARASAASCRWTRRRRVRRASSAGTRSSGTSWRTSSRCSSRTTECRAG